MNTINPHHKYYQKRGLTLKDYSLKSSHEICRHNLTSCKNLLSHAMFQRHDHASAKIDWALKQYRQLVVEMWPLKTLKTCFTEGAFNHLPFSWQSLQQTPHQHERRNSSGEKMTCCAVWREMSFMGFNTANGVIIYDHCILLFLSRLFLCFSACTVMRKEPHFSLLFTYSCNNPLCFFPFTFIWIFYSIYDYGLCGAYPILAVCNE